MKNFKQGYKDFKVWHTKTLNIIFHFLTSILQIYFIFLFIINFNFLYLLGVLVIPFITDAIGHLTEKNFGMVLLVSKMSKSTNSAGVNGFYKFLYRIMLFCDKFLVSIIFHKK
tara:strand:+ start:1050 stop:1388 length:339 start_codon:yes stop_codon:yes gene_type:complete